MGLIITDTGDLQGDRESYAGQVLDVQFTGSGYTMFVLADGSVLMLRGVPSAVLPPLPFHTVVEAERIWFGHEWELGRTEVLPESPRGPEL